MKGTQPNTPIKRARLSPCPPSLYREVFSCTLTTDQLEAHGFPGYEGDGKHKGWLRFDRGPTSTIFGLDCEMCLTTSGNELIRATLLHFDGRVLYDKLVKPSAPIIDYCSEYSGVKPQDMAGVKTTLAQVQEELRALVYCNDILVGHGLENDLQALQIIHGAIADTSVLFPHKKAGRKYSLRKLARLHIGRIIQRNAGGHNSCEDAIAALDLAIHIAARRARAGITTRPSLPCLYFLKGCCVRGEVCSFLHDYKLQPVSEKLWNRYRGGLAERQEFKTKPCRYFNQGWCSRGDKCTFLHDGDEDECSMHIPAGTSPSSGSLPAASFSSPTPSAYSLFSKDFLAMDSAAITAPAAAAPPPPSDSPMSSPSFSALPASFPRSGALPAPPRTSPFSFALEAFEELLNNEFSLNDSQSEEYDAFVVGSLESAFPLEYSCSFDDGVAESESEPSSTASSPEKLRK